MKNQAKKVTSFEFVQQDRGLVAEFPEVGLEVHKVDSNLGVMYVIYDADGNRKMMTTKRPRALEVVNDAIIDQADREESGPEKLSTNDLQIILREFLESGELENWYEERMVSSCPTVRAELFQDTDLLTSEDGVLLKFGKLEFEITITRRK